MSDPAEKGDITFDRSFVAHPGETVQLSPRVRRILAGNPGPMTFSGTCTYVVGKGAVAIIDPGPALAGHIAALLDALRNETVETILVTHTHRDHCGAAAVLKAATGAKIIGCPPHMANDAAGSAFDSAHDETYMPDAVMAEGDRITGKDFTLEAVATPGHTGNHLAFSLAEEAALFSGDHVMAWATSVVLSPDGRMADYIDSLTKLQRRDERLFWPGHGNAVKEPQPYLAALIRHRRSREAAILRQLSTAAMTASDIVAAIYRDLDPALRLAARVSVLAHLEDLVARGSVAIETGRDPNAEAFYRRR